MKIASLVVLSFFTAVLGLAPIASADPGEQNKAKAFNAQAGEKGVSGEAKGGGWKAYIKDFLASKPGNHGNAALGGIQGSPEYQGSVAAQSVPVPGTLLLFGVGFGAFTVWHQRSRRRMSASA